MSILATLLIHKTSYGKICFATLHFQQPKPCRNNAAFSNMFCAEGKPKNKTSTVKQNTKNTQKHEKQNDSSNSKKQKTNQKTNTKTHTQTKIRKFWSRVLDYITSGRLCETRCCFFFFLLLGCVGVVCCLLLFWFCVFMSGFSLLALIVVCRFGFA